jgi:hypothetical protein
MPVVGKGPEIDKPALIIVNCTFLLDRWFCVAP